jgi:hypothetical protein
MGNQTAIAKGRVEVEAARGQARDGGDPSLGNPMEDMTIAARTALNATKNAGPLVAERVKDAERLLNDVMAFEQTADRISRAVEQGDMDRDQARRQADRELRKAASRIRGRWDQLTKRTQGLPQVLGMRAFPDPGRDATSAEVKADIERKLAKANTATDLIPAMTDLARQAIGRGDMAVASQLAGDFGQTLIDKRDGRRPRPRPARHHRRSARRHHPRRRVVGVTDRFTGVSHRPTTADGRSERCRYVGGVRGHHALR